MSSGDLSSKRAELDAARVVFLEGVRSGLSRTAAATVAGVSHTTGNRWAECAGYPPVARHHGIRYSAAVREAFWAAMYSGDSPEQAAVHAGVSLTRARIWVKQAGYVPRTQTLPPRRDRFGASTASAVDVHRTVPTRGAARIRLHPAGRGASTGPPSRHHRPRDGQGDDRFGVSGTGGPGHGRGQPQAPESASSSSPGLRCSPRWWHA